MNDNLELAIDAYSASPALRLRYRILAAKASAPPPQPVPPAVGGLTETILFGPSSRYAVEAGDPRAVLMRMREHAADEIDRLLEFLDASEGDVDAEEVDEDGEEPEHREDGGDSEPSLGFSEPVLTGLEHNFWWPYHSTDAAQHRPMHTEATDDREGEHDGAEPSEDDEPSLCGVTADICTFDDQDREEQCDDEGCIESGIADTDGLLEQLSGFYNVGSYGSSGLASHAE